MTMLDYETIMVCALIPVMYVVTYMAGKYDLIGQFDKMLQENAENLTKEDAKENHQQSKSGGKFMIESVSYKKCTCDICGASKEIPQSWAAPRDFYELWLRQDGTTIRRLDVCGSCYGKVTTYIDTLEAGAANG